MSLQFVLGNSGSGKTDDTYQKIVKEAAIHQDRQFLIIVPEQYTLSTQRKLVELAPGQVIMNIDVLSFKRLAYRVFDDLGIGTLQILEETGKNLILRKIAEDEKDKLTVMKDQLRRMGYIDEVKSLISEFVQYAITPEKLEEYLASHEVSASFEARLRDILVIYRSFNRYMKDRYITAEEILQVLIEVADRSELLKNSVIVFDEYTGFTPIQNQLIRKLFTIADRIQVILTIDQRNPIDQIKGEHELFYLTKKTIRQLTRMAEELKVPVLSPVYMPGSAERRFAQAKDLGFLEQQLFRPWYSICKEKPEHIALYSALNPKEELTKIAREIRRLIQEEGCRYQDIAVVSGAVDTYAPYIEEIFGRYGVRYYLDQTTDIVFHPFIEAIRALLQAAAEDMSYEAVFRFLRSGLSGIPEDQIDRLDYYVTAVGIRGKKAWENRFLRYPQEKSLCNLEELEQLRLQVISIFRPLMTGKDSSVSERVLALYEVLTDLGAEQYLWEKEKALLEAGEQVRSREYGQLYPIVMSLLEKYDELLGSEKMSTEEFAEILDAGLSAAKVATLPPGYDCVTIGDIERTRLNHVKILFFIGVNDGIIPKAGGSGGIISEFERELMQDAELELAPGAREQAFIQRFYLYRNLTKPSGRLYLSYHRVNMDGEAVRPSYLIQNVERLFPALKPEQIEDLSRNLSLATPAAAKEYLIHGERDEAWMALAAYFMKQDPDTTGHILDAAYLNMAADPISKVVADALYGHTLKGSVTRLEKFAACAYAHFLKYGLMLKEREESGMAAADIGNLYHDALLRYSQKLEQSEWDWHRIPDDIRDEYAADAFAESLAGFPNFTAFATAEDQHLAYRIEAIFKQTVWALTKQVRAGRFVPTAFELSFRSAEDTNSLRMLLEDGHTMELYGRIDRMDLCRDQGQYYVKVIDYKSGSQNFDLIRVYHGLSLQLIVYMTSVTEYVRDKYHTETVTPGAVFYYHIDDPEIRLGVGEEKSREELENAILEALKPNGLVNNEEPVYRAMDELFESKSQVIPVSLNKDGSVSKYSSTVNSEEFQVLQEYVANHIRAYGRKIYEGDISIDPYETPKQDSCKFCDYSSICGVKSGLAGIKKRGFENLKKEDILEAMRTANAMAEHQAGI